MVSVRDELLSVRRITENMEHHRHECPQRPGQFHTAHKRHGPHTVVVNVRLLADPRGRPHQRRVQRLYGQRNCHHDTSLSGHARDYGAVPGAAGGTGAAHAHRDTRTRLHVGPSVRDPTGSTATSDLCLVLQVSVKHLPQLDPVTRGPAGVGTRARGVAGAGRERPSWRQRASRFSQ